MQKVGEMRDEMDWPNASFIDSLPISHERTQTTTVAPRVPCEYGPAEEGAGSCPEGSAALTEAECRNMPFRFGGVLHSPFVIESDEDPWGCFLFEGKYYYNSGYLGKGRPHRTPFCKRCQAIPAVAFAGPSHWSSGAYAIHRASLRFRLVHQGGGCTSRGMHPVTEQAVCERAAKELRLPERQAALTCLEERPEGCYYWDNQKEGQGMLFLNVNPLSRGSGAETSDFGAASLRIPICSLDGEAGGDEEEGPADSASPSAAELGVCKAEAGGARKITQGTCSDIGREPILNADACEAAAKQLALVDTEVEVTQSPHRPHGCYYFRNTEDLTATLWLNAGPESEGRGAEPLRHILCAGP